MTALVEAVARAIQESAAEYRLRPFIDGWDRDYVRLAADRFVRAAIEAIKPFVVEAAASLQGYPTHQSEAIRELIETALNDRVDIDAAHKRVSAKFPKTLKALGDR